jgi:hypothetical protein
MGGRDRIQGPTRRQIIPTCNSEIHWLSSIVRRAQMQRSERSSDVWDVIPRVLSAPSISRFAASSRRRRSHPSTLDNATAPLPSLETRHLHRKTRLLSSHHGAPKGHHVPLCGHVLDAAVHRQRDWPRGRVRPRRAWNYGFQRCTSSGMPLKLDLKLHCCI